MGIMAVSTGISLVILVIIFAVILVVIGIIRKLH